MSAFSARICGYINPPTTGTFLFRTTYQGRRDAVCGLPEANVDSWTYAGSQLQTVGTITLTQGVWSSFVLEHTTAGTATEKMLVECSANAGTLYSTLAHGTTQAACSSSRTTCRSSRRRSSGRAMRSVGCTLATRRAWAAGMVLPNANYFSGNTSELNNDGGYVKHARRGERPCVSAVHPDRNRVGGDRWRLCHLLGSEQRRHSQNYTGILNSGGQVVIPSTGIYSLRFQADYASITGIQSGAVLRGSRAARPTPGRWASGRRRLTFGCEPITESAFTGNFQGGELVTGVRRGHVQRVRIRIPQHGQHPAQRDKLRQALAGQRDADSRFGDGDGLRGGAGNHRDAS